jgi:hypothetical protein
MRYRSQYMTVTSLRESEATCLLQPCQPSLRGVGRLLDVEVRDARTGRACRAVSGSGHGVSLSLFHLFTQPWWWTHSDVLTTGTLRTYVWLRYCGCIVRYEYARHAKSSSSPLFVLSYRSKRRWSHIAFGVLTSCSFQHQSGIGSLFSLFACSLLSVACAADDRAFRFGGTVALWHLHARINLHFRQPQESL